ncbi:hypothetical protein YPPY91_4685, partial [Yersinia pestis PY-91]|jgi:hypothetical protein
MADLP